MWLNIAAFIIILMLGGLLYQMRVLTQMMSKNLMSQNILSDKIDDVAAGVAKKGGVTDPFVAANKSNTLGASSKHIVIRKTPDQIRNENYQKLKESGAAYGSDH